MYEEFLKAEFFNRFLHQINTKNSFHHNYWQYGFCYCDISSHCIPFLLGFGFKAPSDAAEWARAKQNAMSGKQILLQQGTKIDFDLISVRFLFHLNLFHIT